MNERFPPLRSENIAKSRNHSRHSRILFDGRSHWRKMRPLPNSPAYPRRTSGSRIQRFVLRLAGADFKRCHLLATDPLATVEVAGRVSFVWLRIQCRRLPGGSDCKFARRSSLHYRANVRDASDPIPRALAHPGIRSRCKAAPARARLTHHLVSARRVCYPDGDGCGASNHTVIAHAIKQKSFTSAP